jgi:putative MFS transporter
VQIPLVKVRGGEDGPFYELGSKIDRLDRIPLRLSVIVAISLASFFTYYDVSNYAYASPVLKNVWGVSDAEIATGASLTILGYVIGALCITLLADYRGRRTAFIMSILLLGIGSIMSALSQNMSQLMIFRLLTGVGIGSELAIASVYIGEISPKSKRGRYTSLLTVLGWLGLTASGPISLFLLQDRLVGAEVGWRVVFGIAGAVAFISLPFRMRMPESPRWLLSKGRLEETNKVLQSLGVSKLEATGWHPDAYHQESASRLHSLRSRVAVRRIVLLGAVWLLALIPVYSSLLLVVEYVNQGYTISQSISINLLSGVGFVAGGTAAILLADKMERKHQIALASLGLSIGFIMRGFLVNDFGGLVFAGFIAFFSNAWVVTALLVYTAENFDTRIRSSAAGIVEGSSRGLAALAPLIFIALQPHGFMNVMLGIALFSLVGACLVMLFGIRTRGQPLEGLSREQR